MIHSLKGLSGVLYLIVLMKCLGLQHNNKCYHYYKRNVTDGMTPGRSPSVLYGKCKQVRKESDVVHHLGQTDKMTAAPLIQITTPAPGSPPGANQPQLPEGKHIEKGGAEGGFGMAEWPAKSDWQLPCPRALSVEPAVARIRCKHTRPGVESDC